MNILAYKKSLFSWRMLREVGKNFFATLGIILVGIELFVINFPESFQYGYGWNGLIIVITVAFIISIFLTFPRKSFSKRFSFPDIEINLRIGDILTQRGHMVIGFSDTFDTEIGDIISSGSLQGQFLYSLYGNNRQKLDQDLDSALADKSFVLDSQKIKGKNKRYKIGTTVALDGQFGKFFCCGYSRMGNDLKATSDVDSFWLSLEDLWQEIRLKGEQKTIFMPIIGTNLSRIKGVSYIVIMKIILLSFIINSRLEPICKHLVLVIDNRDMQKINLLEIRDFVNSLDG